jgi:hypothetical protein
MRKLALVLIASAGCALSGVRLEQFELPDQPGVWFIAARGGVLADRTRVAHDWHQHVADLCGERAQILESHLDDAVGLAWSRPAGVTNASGSAHTIRKPFMEGYVRCGAVPASETADHP